MAYPRNPVRWLGLLAGVLWASGGVRGADLDGGRPVPVGSTAAAPSVFGLPVPIDGLPAEVRDGVRRVMERPTLATHGPAELFRGQPALYHWLLEHPDRAVQMWRRLGARCVEITDQGGGRFGWSDGEGSAVHWQAVYHDGRVRVWYAEGHAKASPLLPAVPVRAVVVLHYGAVPVGKERPLLHHQADLFLQIDSRTAALIARLLGPSAPRLAHEGLAQLEMFFSALVWYLDRHPDRAPELLGFRTEDLPAPAPEARSEGSLPPCGGG